MFDFISICWWLLQACIIGFVITSRVFEEKANCVIYAPITGMSITLLLATGSWFWDISNSVGISFYIAILALSFVYTFNYFRKNSFSDISKISLALLAGAMLVAAQGAFIPFVEKLFQGYPLDRFVYVSASILFSKFEFSYFTDAVARLEFNGDIRSFLNNPVLPMAMIELKARVAPEISFIFVNFLDTKNLYKLANAWEVYFRVLEFFGAYAFLYSVTRNIKRSLLVAVPVIFSYWIQYEKDFNAWAHLLTVAFIYYFMAYIYNIANSEKFMSIKHKYLFYLLTIAMVINHPEFSVLLLAGIVPCAIISSDNFRKLFFSNKFYLLEIVVITATIFLIHPYIYSWLIRQFALSPAMVGGIETITKGFYYIFTETDHRNILINEINSHPIQILIRPEIWSDMLIGLFGFSPLAYVGSIGTLFFLAIAFGVLLFNRYLLNPNNRRSLLIGILLFTIIVVIAVITNNYFDINRITQSWNNLTSVLGALCLSYMLICCITKDDMKRYAFSLLFFMYFLVAFAVFIIIKSPGGAYRLIGIWGSFSTLLFATLICTSGNKLFKPIAIFILIFYMFMGISVFIYQNNKGYEYFPKFYPSATGFRHFEVETVRDKWNYDYRNLESELKLCKSVYVNLPSAEEFEQRAPRFFMVNIMLFLENNNISYFLSNKYLNVTLLGEALYNGYPLSRYQDCELSQEIIDGRYTYKLNKHHADNDRN